MSCPECGSEQLVLGVPPDLRAYLPEEAERVAVCTHCLTLEPTDAGEPRSPDNRPTTADADPADAPDFAAISDAFPSGDAGVAMALAVGLLDSLALYRDELTALLERVERGGADPLLVLDRLGADPELEPHFDVERRRTQVEQLLYS